MPGWRGWTEGVLEIEAAEAPPGRVLFALEQRGGFVRLVLGHDGLVPAAARRLLDAGWSACLGRLAALASRSATT